MLLDIVSIEAADYDCLLGYEQEAIALDYPVLR